VLHMCGMRLGKLLIMWVQNVQVVGFNARLGILWKVLIVTWVDR
jgi:hypothetical protein